MAKKTKILFVLNEFVFGSKIRTLIDLVSKLDRERYDIWVAGYTIDDIAVGEIRKLGVPIFQLRLVPPKTLNLGKLLTFLRSLFTLRKGNYDVIHTLTYQSLFFDAFVVRLLTRAVFLYSKTNLQWDNHRLNWSLKSRLSHAIVSISSATDELLTRVGFASKIHKIPIGVDADRFSYREAEAGEMRAQLGIDRSVTLFGCAAQFIHWKGHHHVLEAFESVAQTRPDAALVFCGENYGDEYYLTLRRKVEQSPLLAPRVFFAGIVKNMPAFFSAIDCMVLPSTEETFGYVFIEAMSCGRPIIACNRFGPRDIVEHGVCGYLVEPNAPAEVAKHMRTYASDSQLRQRHGAAGRERVLKLFSSTAMAAQHDQLYQSLLRKRSGHA